MWGLSVHPGALKRKKKKPVVENCGEVTEKVRSLANKLANTFASLESALRHSWNNFVALLHYIPFICINFGMYYVQCLMLWLIFRKLLFEKIHTSQHFLK